MLSQQEAIDIVQNQIETIINQWTSVCMQANLSETDKRLLIGRQILNPFAFYNLPAEASHLQKLASDFVQNQ